MIRSATLLLAAALVSPVFAQGTAPAPTAPSASAAPTTSAPAKKSMAKKGRKMHKKEKAQTPAAAATTAP